MSVRFVRPVSRFGYAARTIGFFTLLFFVVVWLLHRFGPLKTPDFIALVLLSSAMAGIAALCAVIGLARLWYNGAKGGIAAAQGLFLALPPLAVVLAAAMLDWRNPAIFEVSSDLNSPPPWISAPVADQQWLPPRRERGSATRQAQLAAFPELTGRRYEGAIDRVYAGVRSAVALQGMRISLTEGLGRTEPDIMDRPLAEDDDQGLDGPPDIGPVPLPRPLEQSLPLAGTDGDVLLQGETRSFLAGLRFDVVIRLRESGDAMLVDIRVASRYSDRDLGMSAEIARDFLAALDAELPGIAGH